MGDSVVERSLHSRACSGTRGDRERRCGSLHISCYRRTEVVPTTPVRRRLLLSSCRGGPTSSRKEPRTQAYPFPATGEGNPVQHLLLVGVVVQAKENRRPRIGKVAHVLRWLSSTGEKRRLHAGTNGAT